MDIEKRFLILKSIIDIFTARELKEFTIKDLLEAADTYFHYEEEWQGERIEIFEVYEQFFKTIKGE